MTLSSRVWGIKVMVSRDGIVKTVVDIGSGKIKAIIGELASNGESLKVLKYADGPSKGMIKGEVVDSEALSKSIQDVLNKLRAATNEPIKSISIGITGENIKSRTVNIEYPLDQEKNIEEEDIQKLIKKAEEKVFSGGEQVLKTEIYNIRVDNSGIVKNPIGVLGEKLQGDVHLVYTNEETISKLVSTVNLIDVDVEKIILNPYAAAKSTLDEEDMRMGVALVDIGEGTTDIILYKNEKLIYVESIPLGGRHFKTDIMYLYKIDEDTAQEILDKYRTGKIEEDNTILYNNGEKAMSVVELEKIISARLREIIEFTHSTIQKSGFTGYLGKGLVLTGGVIGDNLINVDELLDMINQKTGYVARRVLPPNDFSGLGTIDPGMATVIGLFYEVMEEEDKKQKTGSYTHQEIEVKNERRKIQPQEDDISNILEEESNQEIEQEEKKGFMSKAKEWFSHFI